MSQKHAAYARTAMFVACLIGAVTLAILGGDQSYLAGWVFLGAMFIALTD